MLVLSRKVEEKILIGDGIEVTLLRIGKSSVRIGIKAPAHVNIVRAELEDDDGDEARESGS